MHDKAQRSNVADSQPTRLTSLDVFRGITIAFTILVDNNGDEQHAYWPLKHSLWNGWTPTDLVFPAFLFVAGISLVFSFESRLAKGASKSALLLLAARRSIILFLLGVGLNGLPLFHWPSMRIYGVLQRIAICLLIASILYLWDRSVESKVAVVIAALVGYWILMRWIPVPGYGLPTRDIPLLDRDANWVAYVDRHLFSARRLYEGTRDPEGLLSNLPALATTLLGVLTGMWLRTDKNRNAKFIGLLAAGIACLSLGKLWGHSFPINKNLWTSSFVLFTAGWSLLGLSICYWAIEIKQWKRGWTFPWIVFGSNAITAYVFSELLSPALSSLRIGSQHKAASSIIYTHLFAHVPDPALGSLLYSLAFVAVCFIPVLILYKERSSSKFEVTVQG